MINDCVEVLNGRNVETHKKIIGDVLMKKLLSKIHHSGSAFSIDKISEDLKEILKQFHPDERISFENNETVNDGTIVSVERKGGAKFYVVNQNGKNLPNKINGLDIKRKFDPDDDELKDFIKIVSTKIPGKPWEVNEDLRSEYDIVNKLASLFCTTPKSKNAQIKAASSSESSDEEEPVQQIRRSGAGLPPTSNRKIVEKKAMKLMKEKLKEDDKKRKQSEIEAVKLAKKKELQEKKDQIKKEKQEQKEQEKETKKLEKEKKENEKNVKKNSEKKPITIKDAFAMKSSSTPTTTEGSPPKAREKRLQLHVGKLKAAWDIKNIKEFNEACTRAANNLSLSMIEKIEDPLIKFSVTKQYDVKKDNESMKGMSKDNKRLYKEKVKENRKALYNEMEPKVKNHFKLDQYEFIEDLTVNTTSLPIIGREIVLPKEKLMHFPDCLMLSQFVTSMKRFFEADIRHTAEELLDAIFDGEKGYLKVSCSVLKAFLSTLVNVEEYMKIAHMNSRLRDLVFDEGTLSEICRAFMVGDESISTRIDRSEENKARLAEKRKALGLELDGSETGSKGEDLEEAGDEEEEEVDDPDDEGRSTPGSQLEKSQIEAEEVELLLQSFKPSSNFWELTPVIQIDVMKYLMFKILDTQSYRDFVNERSTEYVNSLKKKVQTLKDQIEEQRVLVKALPVYEEEADMSMLSRIQSKERAETIRKKKDYERRISDMLVKVADLTETLAPHAYMSHTCRGFVPVGYDRNRRAYYLFYTKTRDRGLWVQDFHEQKYNGLSGLDIVKEENQTESESVDREKWYHIDKEEDILVLASSLNKVGSRERRLEKFLSNNKSLLEKCYKLHEATSESPTNEEKTEDFNALLKTDILQVSKDLCESYLSDLDAVAYEAKVVSADTLDDLKTVMIALIDSIPVNAIQTDIGREEGFFTCFKVQRWKRRLSEAHNISALLLLLRILDTRIDWKKGTTEKSCTICGSKRSPDAKIACLDCGKVFHYYCTRPKLQEKPLKYTCAGCKPRTPVKNTNYTEATTSEEEEEEEDEDEDDENEETSNRDEHEEYEDDDDDYYSSRNRTRAAKRKASINSLNNSKRSRNSPPRRLRTSLRNQ
ncbi:unnamed protein product [Auanema sp. JU1783]|nr:unnamed protein product [Auanema sp. JU1783]